ncbi:MAG: adenosylcobinamide-GDP ribazoletransferase [Pseudomonadota bacterium]
MRGVLAALSRDARGALGFFTRLPVRCDDATPAALRMAPFAGFVVGTFGAGALVATTATGLSPTVAAFLVVATLLLVTGALHEDGLADTFDALGARSKERRLDIMRDSHIGTYGVCALVVAIGLKVSLLVSLIDAGLIAAALAVISAAIASRTMALWPLYRLPPARADGLGAWSGAVPRERIIFAFSLTIAWICVASALLLSFAPIAALLFAWLTSELFARLARRLFGGQTGDVAGATQQVAELAFLITLTISLAN